MQDQKSEGRLATLTHKVASSVPLGSIKLYEPSIDPVVMATLFPLPSHLLDPCVFIRGIPMSRLSIVYVR